MTFVNQVITDCDVDKYSLDEIMRKADPASWREGRPIGFVYHWTVDRERGMFLLPIDVIQEIGASGRPEPTGRSRWLLDAGGQRAWVTLELAEGSSKRFSDAPFRIVWDLVHMDLGPGDLDARGATSLLREALTVHGQRGAQSRVPAAQVEFRF